MVLNAADPTVVDSFSIYAEGRLIQKPDPTTSIVLDEGVGFVNPDNLAVGHSTLMVQEDNGTLIGGTLDNGVWRNPLGTTSWSQIATAVQHATAETSGIIDASAWLGVGWWVLDVQSHVNLLPLGPMAQYQTPLGGPLLTYQTRREDGQLLLMYVPGS